MMSKHKITVGVTGLNNIDSPGPGIPVIRALKESNLFDVRIIGLSYESLEPGLFRNHCQHEMGERFHLHRYCGRLVVSGHHFGFVLTQSDRLGDG